MPDKRREPTHASHSAIDRYLALFAGFDAGIIEVDASGVVVATNDRFCELVGLPRSDVVGADLPHPWWPDDQRAWYEAQFGRALGSAARRGKFSGKFHRSDGSRIEIVGNASLLLDGVEHRLVMAVRDATALGEAVDAVIAEALALAHSDPKLQETLSQFFAANIIGIIGGRDNRILAANDAFLSMIGFARTDLESGGIDWPNLTPPEWLDADAKACETLMTTGASRPYEKEYLRRDGSRVWVRNAMAVVHWEPFHWVAFVEDLTDQHTAENERDAAQRALAVETDALEAANMLHDRAMQRLVHDLRSPIATLVGFTSILDASDTPPDIEAEVRAAIRRAAQTLNTFIEQLTENHGRAPSELLAEQADLQEIATSVAELFAPDLAAVGARLRIDGSLPVVTANRAGLHSVLQNLVTNAIRYRHGERPLRIDITAEDEPDQTTVIVTDNGRGIPPEDHRTVFEYRRRGSDADADAGTGLGIGLAAARTIVETHGGTIWVDDNPGGGCRLSLTIPKS